MDRLRRTSVAGRWYPDDPVRLAADVDRYIADADVDPLPHHPRAVVAPHAGLMYSGPVAGFAYKVARDTSYGTIVLVGPSHFVPFRGVSLWGDGTWETPFGEITVDRKLSAAIRSESHDVVDVAAAHGREHSLEMQLPFIAHLLPGVPIVPLVMGHQTRETAFALGEAIARAVAARTPAQTRDEVAQGRPADEGNRHEPTGPSPGEVLLVASSDLSHYEDARTASSLDAVVAGHVEAVDPEALMTALEREPRHACGGGPMVAVLHAARQLGATTARVLRYADSGDISGDKSSVVGYMAAAIW
jgi:predicted class III extradiol MEMO1 family dioxygenase